MRTARTSLIVSAIAAGVTLLSLINQLAIARTFGATGALDDYLLATSIPLLVTGTFGGLFAYAMVPALVRAAADDDHRAHTTAAFFLAMLTAGAIVAVVGIGEARAILALLAAGRTDARIDLLVPLARIAWLAAAVSVVGGFLGAMLNVHGRFVLPVVATALPYVGMVAGIVIGGRRSGVIALAWGNALGTIAGTALLLAAGRTALTFRSLTRLHFTPVRLFAISAPLALLSTVAFTIYQSVDAFWAPRLGPANLSVLGYCQRMLIVLGSVMAVGPSVVLQPRLAAASARGDETAFVSDLGRALRVTLLVCAPAALGISMLAHPIVRLAFERGAFTRAATVAVAGVLPWMLAGMVPMVCTVMVFKALYAKSDLRTVTMLGIAGPVLYFIGSGALMGVLGLDGIGIAYLGTWVLLAAVATTRVSSRVPGLLLEPRFLRDLVLVLAAAAGPALLLRQTVLASWAELPTGGLALRVLAAAVVGAGSYLLVALLVARVEDLRLLARGLRRS